MKRIYIASRFQFDTNGTLKNDFRAHILGNESFLLEDHCKTIIFNNEKYRYVGPFFNEKAAEHNLSASFGKIVVDAEKKSIDECDTFIAIFDNEVSPGTTTELIYAAMSNKECYLFYQSNDNKSENWFPIEFAKSLGIDVVSYKDINEVEKIFNFNK